MSARTVQYTAGSNVVGLLGVAFVVLKLTGVIAWSWWWVLAPFWVPVAVAVVVLVVVFALVGVQLFIGVCRR